MSNNNRHHWNAAFAEQSPLFEQARELVAELCSRHLTDWPTLADYQQLLTGKNPGLCSQHGAPIQFVAQGGKPLHFEEHYEPRIYLKGEVQTRCQNWHDFFQVLIWCQFPETKVVLNALHYHAAIKRHTATPYKNNRSPLENAITLFDECGVIVTSSDPSLLDLIRNFQWQELFWHRRNELNKNLQCFIFGHALFEKALQPYIGMTGHALLLDIEDYFHHLGQVQQLRQLDEKLCALLNSNRMGMSTDMLTPFPLLGMPGWHRQNDQEDFYGNTAYFRSSRNKTSTNRSISQASSAEFS